MKNRTRLHHDTDHPAPLQPTPKTITIPHRSGDHNAHPALTRVLHLQRTHGNRYVQRWLQRQEAVVAPTRPMVAYGSKGSDVIFLQRRLNLHGADLVEDGDFGPATRAAVINFQTEKELNKIDGIVGEETWGALETNPTVTETPDTTATTLSTMPLEQFEPMVNANLIDRPIGALLNDTRGRFPDATWLVDTGNFALEELRNGNLVGIVGLSNLDKLRARVPKSEHPTLDDIAKNGLGSTVGASYHVFDSQGITRGYIVVNEGDISEAEEPGSERDELQLFLIHEIAHHRNRNKEDALYGKMITSADYVDVPLALKLSQGGNSTVTVRGLYIDELTARHVAWRAIQDRRTARNQTAATITQGQFFNQCVHFARHGQGAYNDNGYMKTLSEESPDDRFRQQVGLWMRELMNMEFHSDPLLNAEIKQFMASEYAFAESQDFAADEDDRAGLG